MMEDFKLDPDDRRYSWNRPKDNGGKWIALALVIIFGILIARVMYNEYEEYKARKLANELMEATTEVFSDLNRANERATSRAMNQQEEYKRQIEAQQEQIKRDEAERQKRENTWKSMGGTIYVNPHSVKGGGDLKEVKIMKDGFPYWVKVDCRQWGYYEGGRFIKPKDGWAPEWNLLNAACL